MTLVTGRRRTEPPPLSFAAQLKRSYDDYDLCLAWVCGYDAAQREIEEWEEK